MNEAETGQHFTAVTVAARKYRRAKKVLDEAHDEVIDTVLAALRAGERPTDVAGWSPFTATYVRRLARKNGIGPERPSRRPDSHG